MFHPNISYTQRGIPVISRKQMDEYAEKYLEDFCPECLKEPCAVDIDQFAMKYLGLNQDFQSLSKQGVYLGMILFHDSDRVEVYDEENDVAKYISEKANTIIIDNSLLEDGQEERYRFTMGHECGHGIFHRPGVSDPYDEYLRLFYGDSSVEMFRCNLDDRAFVAKEKTQWTDQQWKEWQADAFSSSILMPKSMVIKAIDEIRSFTDPGNMRNEFIRKISGVFKVSHKAAEIRLSWLGLIESEEQILKRMDLKMQSQAHRWETMTDSVAAEERMFHERDMELWGYEVQKKRGRRRKRS